MAQIEIRPLRAGDEADWRRLWGAYLAFYETSLPEENYRSAFARLLAEDPRDHSGLIAFVDGRAEGLAHYLFHRDLWRIEEVCYLQDLFVTPGTRGTGLGRQLIEAVYARADQHGAAETYWLTQDFNATARRLYDRIGTLTPFLVYSRERP